MGAGVACGWGELVLVVGLVVVVDVVVVVVSPLFTCKQLQHRAHAKKIVQGGRLQGEERVLKQGL